MFDEEIRELVTDLAAADPAVCDRDELAGLVKQSQRVRGWLDAVDARIALRASALVGVGAADEGDPGHGRPPPRAP